MEKNVEKEVLNAKTIFLRKSLAAIDTYEYSHRVLKFQVHLQEDTLKNVLLYSSIV